MNLSQQISSCIELLGGLDRIWIGNHNNEYFVLDKRIDVNFLIKLDNLQIVLNTEWEWTEYSYCGSISDIPVAELRNLCSALLRWDDFIQEKISQYQSVICEQEKIEAHLSEWKVANCNLIELVSHGDYDAAQDLINNLNPQVQ